MSTTKKFALGVLAAFMLLVFAPIVSEYGLTDGLGVFALIGLMCVVAPVLTLLALWAVVRRGR